MGYYTYFTIEEISGENEKKLLEDFDLLQTEYGPLNEMFDEIPGYAHDAMKWYACHDDMKRISKEYPNTLIIMRGNGEETEDVWQAYYRNGQHEISYVKFEFDDPTEGLLNNTPLIDYTQQDIADEEF